MESNNVFKVGKLQNLDSKIEVSELENGCLDFFISSNSKQDYSLEFTSTITKKDFLKFELGKEIDLQQFIDTNDIVVGENGTFNLNCNFNLKINHYIPNSFLLILSVRTEETYLYIENEFKL